MQRLMRLVKESGGMNVQVRRKGLTESYKTLEPLVRISEDAWDILQSIIMRKNTHK